MEDKRVVIRVAPEMAAVIEKYAEKHKVEKGEAADRVIGIAQSRMNALARYAKNKEPMAPGKPRKAPAKKKAAKKVAAAAKKPKALTNGAAHA